jgi:hypothetical protein
MVSVPLFFNRFSTRVRLAVRKYRGLVMLSIVLWIDALCIIQDSDTDKQHEIATMQWIYKNALITMVVASSSDVTNGFLQPRAQLSTAYTYTIPFGVATNVFETVSLSAMEEIVHEEWLELINSQ